MFRLLCLGHAAANRLKDFRLSQPWYQQPQLINLRGPRPHITARTSAPVDKAPGLQVAQRAVYGDSRRVERLDQLSFARETLACRIPALADRVAQMFINVNVFRRRFAVDHEADNTTRHRGVRHGPDGTSTM